MTSSIEELIERNDPDELIREIDRCCAGRNWEALADLRRRCRSAVEIGKQLWGVAGHGEYRLALEAPAEFAAGVVDAESVPLAIGPLPEVVASSHDWDSLAPYLTAGPVRAVVAYECVVRGADLRAVADAPEMVAAFEMPLHLASWEPRYPLAVYTSFEVKADPPLLKPGSVRTVRAASAFEVIDQPDAVGSLKSLAQVWSAQSNGKVRVCAVAGGVAEALAGLDVASASVGRIDLPSAVAHMAWTAASSGFHGQRSGLAAGRRKAWLAVAGICNGLDAWPVEAEVLGKEAREIEWLIWDSDTITGFESRLIAVDPGDEVAFGFWASDAK